MAQLLKMPDGKLISVPDDATSEAMDRAAMDYISKIEPANLDKETGASWKARALVGLYDKPEDRLKVMRQLYPDARPFQDDNFIFTDPKSGKPTLFNPKGLDFGDVPGVLREIGTGVGATLGAIGGTIGATPGTGTVVGAGAGGAMAGMGIDKIADALTGVERSYGDKLKNVAVDAVGNAAGEGIGAGINKLIGPQVGRLTYASLVLSRVAAR